MMKNGYSSGQQVEDAMAVLAGWIGKNYGVKVVYHDGSAVNADIFKGIIRIPRLSCASGITEEALMLLRGRVYHESGHIGETNLSKSEYPVKKSLFSILNALEDRRMEAVLADRYEGCKKVLSWQTDYYNKDIAGKAAEGKIDAPLWEALVAMSFMSESRRPMWKLGDKAAIYVEKAYDEFRKVKSCKSAKDCLKLAKVIHDILKEANDEMKEQQKEQEPEKKEKNKDEKQEQEKGDDGSDGSEENEDGEEQDENKSSGCGDFEDEEEDGEEQEEQDGNGGSDENEEESEEDDSGDDSEGSDSDDSDSDTKDEEGAEGSDGEGNSEGSGEGSEKDDLDDECGNEQDGSESIEDGTDGDEEAEVKTYAGGEFDMDKECEGYTMEDVVNDAIENALSEISPLDSRYTSLKDNDEHLVPEAGDREKATYKSRREKISAQVASMSRALEQALRAMAKCRRDPYLRQGRIDKRRLVQISKGLSKEVFCKTRPGRKLDVAVEVIIDESGSMGNYREVQLLAMAIGESLDRIGVPFEITGTTTKYGGGDRNMPQGTGFTRSNPIVYKHYKSFNEGWASVHHRMVKTGRYMHNIDGEAVEHCAMRLGEREETRKVIFSLSDGSPCGGEYHESDLEQNLKRVCERCREDGVEVYGFGIGTSAPMKYYGKDYFIGMSDTSEMGPEFLKKFAEVITKGEVKV